MEFDHLGKRCFLCNQQDFLPIECDLCNKFFCMEHSSIDSHQCPNFQPNYVIREKKKKRKKEKQDIMKKYFSNNNNYENKIIIKNGKIKFSNDCLVDNDDDKNYHTYTDIPLDSGDDMSDLDLNETIDEKKNKNSKATGDMENNTCGSCMLCQIL